MMSHNTKNDRINKLIEEILKAQLNEPDNTYKMQELFNQLAMERHGKPSKGIVMDLSEEEIEDMDKWYEEKRKPSK